MTTGALDSCHGTGSLNKSDGCDRAGRRNGRGFEGFGMTRVRKVDSKICRAPDFGKLKELCVLFARREAPVTDAAISREISHRDFGEVVAGNARVVAGISLNHRPGKCHFMTLRALQSPVFFFVVRKARLIASLSGLVLGIGHSGPLRLDKSYADQENYRRQTPCCASEPAPKTKHSGIPSTYVDRSALVGDSTWETNTAIAHARSNKLS